MKYFFTTILLITLFTATVQAQTEQKWDKWQWLIGTWRGEGSGRPGEGEGYFTFSFELDRNIIVRKNHTVLSGDKTRQVVHDDLMIIYPAPAGKVTKAIYFDNEGHVIEYLVSFSDQSIVFSSQGDVKMPIFRLTYTPHGEDSVNTKFEMSQDGVNFSTYIEGTSSRQILP